MLTDPAGGWRRAFLTFAVVAVTGSLALGAGCSRAPLPPLVGVVLTPVATVLVEPTAGDLQPGTDRMFITERHGLVRVIDRGSLLAEPAIDLVAGVESGFADQGLVGIAFHPRHPDDPRVFLSYTEIGSGDQVVVSFVVDDGGVTFDPSSAVEVIRVSQPEVSHQGGTIRFGPDAMLWIGFGDGGFVPPDTGSVDSQDARRHGQNPFTLLGTVVRIDIDAATPYAIPADNPFRDGTAGLPEVWLYGVRNPWSVWFDSGFVIVGDVGNLAWEEINRLDLRTDAGANLGWSEMEGPACFREPECTAAATTTGPWLALSHPDSCAVIVGPVYRGVAMPELVGKLLVTDLCNGWIRSLPIESPSPAPTEWLPRSEGGPTAFIVGPGNEIYLTTFEGGLFRLDPYRQGDPGDTAG